jgi:tetrapyrrole methylase family protein/MazG family protein
MRWLSTVERALVALDVAPDELQIAQVKALTESCYPRLSTDRAALIGLLVEDVQLRQLGRLLRRAYSGCHSVMVLSGLSAGSLEVQTSALADLGCVELGDGGSLLYVPPLSCPGSVETFQDTVARLRAPDGCPWDRKQTHRSLRQGFQEEAYEVLDALDQGDMDLLVEELGDVLLHILLQVQIGSELGEFRLSDVVCRVSDKIIHRHPHVFGGLEVDGVEEVLVNWEELKQQEKEGRTEAPSSLDGIALAMPALARAQSIQRHIDRMGFVSEEAKDLIVQISAVLSSASRETDPQARQSLFGDLLFGLADLARKLDVDAESALREASTRAERRYRQLERVQREQVQAF